MSTLPTYDFNAPDGSTHLDLTAGEIQRRFVPKRSAQWVKQGLEAGARSVHELAKAADARYSNGLKLVRKASLVSPMRSGIK